jgi:hypothetical protein
MLRRAKLTRTPAQEILLIVAKGAVRPFAPTRLDLIRRRNLWKTTADLQKSAAVSRRIGDQDMAREVSWLRTYTVRESDGAPGTVCIDQAVEPRALSKHAARLGTPVDEIIPVIGLIVLREASFEKPAACSAVPA